LDDEAGVEIVRDGVSLAHLRELADAGFGDLVKAVVDVDGHLMAIGGSMHADEESALLDVGSRQRDLWGINLYPGSYGTPDWVEFDSMINLRPSQGNRSRSVEDAAVCDRILEVVAELVNDG
jgi:hypothetical protein